MMRRWTRTAATAVLQAAAVTVALGVLGACGTTGRAVTPARPGGAARPGPGLAAGARYAFVPATGAQYAAGARFQGTLSALVTGIVAACLAQYGFHVPKVSAAADIAQDFDNSQWPDLAAISRSGQLNPALRYVIPPSAIPRYREQAYAADAERCRRPQQEAIAPLAHAGSRLAGRWDHITSRIQASGRLRQVLTGFGTCVWRTGAPASAAGSLGAFLAWVAGRETGARSWPELVAEDHRWAMVFVRCAGPAVALQDRIELARQALYLRQHRALVAELERLARQTLARAERQYRAALRRIASPPG
jgi:hypothetical protein